MSLFRYAQDPLESLYFFNPAPPLSCVFFFDLERFLISDKLSPAPLRKTQMSCKNCRNEILHSLYEKIKKLFFKKSEKVTCIVTFVTEV